MPILTTFIQHSIGSPSQSNQKRKKRHKRYANWKKSKTGLFTDDILYTENPKDATRKLLQLINELDKVTEYKINIHVILHLS